MGFFSRLFGTEKLERVAENTSNLPSKFEGGSDLGLDAKTAAAILAEIDIDTAISAHENWKLRLQNYLDGRSQEDLRPEVICLDDRCDLGKWLHGPGRERLGKYPAFSVLVARHKYFHVQASTVVALAQAGERDKAQSMIDGAYRHASNQVVLLLKELKRGLGR
jgi:hypothetical protein